MAVNTCYEHEHAHYVDEDTSCTYRHRATHVDGDMIHCFPLHIYSNIDWFRIYTHSDLNCIRIYMDSDIL
jgi:hypothetical protein